MMGGGMMGFGFGGLGWIGWILNLIVTLAVLAGIVLLVVWLVRRTAAGSGPLASPPSSATPSAREIVQLRYARGEITRDQYQQMLGDLS